MLAGPGNDPVTIRIEGHRGSDHGGLLSVNRPVDTETAHPLQLDEAIVDDARDKHEAE